MSSLQKKFFKKYTSHKIAVLLLRKGEIVQIPLTGNCMKPLLRENDLITIQPLKGECLRCGDIAVFQVKGELKSHRFLKYKTINGNRVLITKGDRRVRYDDPVPVANLLGKISQIKKGKKLVDYKSPRWKIINYLLGKLSPYLSFIEYFYTRIRGFIVACLQYALGNKNTGWIKKILHRKH